MNRSNAPIALAGSHGATNFADILGEATLYFLQHGNLEGMATILIRGACRHLGCEAGVLYDFNTEKRFSLLAGFPENFVPPGMASDLARVDTAWLHPFSSHRPYLHTSKLPEPLSSLLTAPCFAGSELIAAVGFVDFRGAVTNDVRAGVDSLTRTIALAIQGARAQQSHQQALEDLRQAQKMEAMGRLAAGIAHDFNNMLTVIGGYASLLARQLPGDSEVSDDVRTILEASNQAADLSRQLLAFSRRQILRPEVVDLNQQIHKLNKLLRRVVREDIDIDLELAESLPAVKTDPGQIEQILMNLVINACDAMPGGGQILIRSGHRLFNETFVSKHKGSLPGEYSWFSIQDSGEGIPPKLLEKIFLPFFTTKTQGKGTGLGLATVYGIVKQSRGYIDVSSSPDEGTCFTIYLPRTHEPPHARPASSIQPLRIPQERRLLLVEDSADVLNYATRVLQQCGYLVVATFDSFEAVDILRSSEAPFDLLITDMVMPKLSGPLLARRLRQYNPALPVLYLSGYGQVTFRSDFTCGEPGQFLSKPFTPEKLIEAVADCLSASSTKEA